MDNGSSVSSERIPGYVRRILELLGSSGYKAYVAGGAVRDIVLGKPPHDYDVATSARPSETAEVFKAAGIDFYDNAARHGTVAAVTGEGDVEVTTFREDGSYSDMRRPDEVVFKTTIEEDVRRRDFTINAMYMDSEGRIYDPVGGEKDCEDRIIRAVGDPKERFGEDALRILRALRFCSSLGFDIESGTLSAMETCAGELKRISAERIAAELIRIVTGRYASKAIRTGWRILSVIIPEIESCKDFDQRSVFHDMDVLEHTLYVLDLIPCPEGGREPEIAMAALFHDLGKPERFKLGDNGQGHMKGHPEASARITERVLNELKYPKQFINDVCVLVLLHDTFIKPDRIEVHKFMCAYPEELLRKLEVLQRADIQAHTELGQRRMARLEELIGIAEELKASGAVFDIKELEIDGNDIISLGVGEGPEIGRILAKVFNSYLEEKCVNTKDSLLKEARRIIGSDQV